MQTIKDILNTGSVTVSFEVFPPKKADAYDSVRDAVLKIADLQPSFMSVTYGAAGTTAGMTVELADEILHRRNVPVLPHLTCVASSRQHVDKMLDTYKTLGIHNCMALRGDLPKDGKICEDFPHASDLIRYIRANSDLCIGAACYPEGHVESHNKAKDIDYLKMKVDAGCDFLTTQMFFDNTIFYNFLYRVLQAGIQIPVIAGIMPITSARQLSRSVSLSGTQVPERFRAIVDRFQDHPDAMKQAGILYASQQIIDLIANDVKHIHVYSMNKPEVAAGILANLSEILCL